MTRPATLKILFAAVWVLLTAIVMAAFSAPILWNDIDFPFWTSHLVFIGTFMMSVRYLFFLRHTFLASRQILKVALVFVCLWGGFLLVDALHDFRLYADETGLQTFMGHLPDSDYTSLHGFVMTEMIFFGVGSVISVFLLAIRLIISIWRWHNLRRA